MLQKIPVWELVLCFNASSVTKNSSMGICHSHLRRIKIHLDMQVVVVSKENVL